MIKNREASAPRCVYVTGMDSYGDRYAAQEAGQQASRRHLVWASTAAGYPGSEG
jgi:hypothetical protein